MVKAKKLQYASKVNLTSSTLSEKFLAKEENDVINWFALNFSEKSDILAQAYIASVVLRFWI